MTKVYSKKDKYGNIYWCKEGTNILHREDGPAIEFVDGTKHWYQNDMWHRADGPAIENNSGHKEWYQSEKCHRTDGPAVIWPNGDKEYWLNDKPYPNIKTDEEWIIFQIIN